MPKIPMVGNRFGRLSVIEEGKKPIGRRQAYWICRCDCGVITHPINGNKLRSGETKSCGCLKVEKTIKRSAKHNLCHTRIYHIWSGMKNRCYNQNSPKYHRYGGRGIRVCDEWLNNLESFYDWAMSNGYRDDFTIDRIDNDGNYEPSNCRWSSNEDQCNNRGHHILLDINGETKNIAQWARESGVKYSTIYARYKQGMVGESLIRKV